MAIVIFVDMDSFYASCELLRHPELRGKAFIVGTHDEKNKLRGVVETASYAAKKAGIKSAMPTVNALKMKPDLLYVASDHDYYDEISIKVMNFLHSFNLIMEVLSIDEAAIDSNTNDYDTAGKIAKEIKDGINKTLQLPCTIGVSTGKTFAKMVCDSAKPDGFKIVRSDELKDFLKDKDVERIPGVGGKTGEKLSEIKIKTIGDLAKIDQITLAQKVGSFGRELYLLANGIDNSQIITQYDIISIGRERTLEERTNDEKEINEMLDKLAEEVIKEVKKNEFLFKTITVKAKYSDFTDKIKGKSLQNYSDSVELLKSTSHTLMKELNKGLQIRKVGVRASSFSSQKGQKRLF